MDELDAAEAIIFVGLGVMPSVNKPEDMNQITSPRPGAHNRIGWFVGPMAASFQVDYQVKAILRQRSSMAVGLRKPHFSSCGKEAL